MAESDFEKCVKALRRLDLFYERRLQRLRRAECRVHEMSAAELRVFEAMKDGRPGTLAWLHYFTGIDNGQLTRVVRMFREGGYAEVAPAGNDGRRVMVTLTRFGKESAIALEEERLRERVVHGTLRMGEDPTAPAT